MTIIIFEHNHSLQAGGGGGGEMKILLLQNDEANGEVICDI